MNFKTWRESHNLTRKEAADLIGCASSHWGNLENGKVKPNKIKAVEEALSFYPDRWQELQDHANNLSPAAIKTGLAKITIPICRSSFNCGLATATLSNYIHGHKLIAEARLETRMMISAYLILGPQTETTAAPAQIQVITPESTNDSFERIQYHIIDGQPWWIVADVCRAIDYKNPSEAVKLARKGDLEKSRASDSMGRIVEQWIVNKNGLMRILAKSNAPKAEPFEAWVFDEVLPSIAETGGYQAQQTTDPLDAMILSLQEIKAAKADILQIKADLAEIKESFSPEKSAEIVMNEAQWTNNAKGWARDCADTITAELMSRGSMESRKKLYSSFWRAHNNFVGVSSHSNICRVAEAERSMMFTRNFAQVRAINLPAFQTTINFNDLLAQKQGVQA